MADTELKIAYIGGGSRDWARKLMIDLALCPELGGRVALYDIDIDAARLNEQLGTWLQDQPGVVSHWKYATVSKLPDALRGADFVVLSIQPGPLEIMAAEIALAEEYGLFFPVGDTTGAPGLVRGLRAATVYGDFAQVIATICPDAWVINYTNPMAICTRTLLRAAPGLKVFGCCHEVYSTQRMLAGLAGRYLDCPAPPGREEIRVNVLGINHFTWIDRAEYGDHDLLELLRHHLAQPGVIRPYSREEVEARNDWFYSADQVKFALFQRLGILAAAGDRHLVEFLPGFIRSPESLFRWGVIRTPVAWRMERWRSAPQKTHDLMTGRSSLNLRTSGEEGVGQIKALLGMGDIMTNVNLGNRGQVSNLPAEVVVETNASFRRDEVIPLSAGALPPGLATLIGRQSANQEMIVEAARTRSVELAFQAVYNDPAHHLAIDAAWEMYVRMLQASRDYLPGWKIPELPN
jgi:alpha-galactosidase